MGFWMGMDGRFRPTNAGTDGGYGRGFEWAFPGDGVVPSSGLEYLNSSGPPEGQHVILGRRGRFSFRNPECSALKLHRTEIRKKTVEAKVVS